MFKQTRMLNSWTRTIFSAACLLLVSSSGAIGSAQNESPESKPLQCTKQTEQGEVITLSGLRDSGLCLIQIKQQAQNIYMEVTRLPVPKTAPPEIVSPKLVSHIQAPSSEKFLPGRCEWLTVYVASLEPVMKLFRDDVKSIHEGCSTLLVPKGTKKEFLKILDEYTKGISQLDGHITAIYDHIDDKENNVLIAKEAYGMYQASDKLEQLRRRAFNLIKHDKGTTELEEVPLKSNSN